jgi:FemAB-related protein (PEP-CTERM system-associated)
MSSRERTYDFVVFSDDWGRHPSSSQHLFKRIMKEHRVLWVNTIGLRAPKADRFTFFRGFEKIREWMRPLREVTPNLHVLSPIMLPIFGDGVFSKWNRRITARQIRRTLKKLGMRRPIIWATVPTAVEYLGRLGESCVIYNVTDDYSLWPGGNSEKIRQADCDLSMGADLIFACSESLVESHRSLNERTYLLPHAVDFEHFSLPADEPTSIKSLGHPRACFFGLIYEKIDFPLLRELALALPNLQIVMIGPVKTDVSLLTLPNVHFLGPIAYETLPAYLQAMDLFIVPYVPDEEILKSGPLKIRECLAVGKPTVVRALPDLESYRKAITLYDRREDFVPAVQKIINSSSLASPELMRDCVRFETWDARVETIMKQISDWYALPEDDVIISDSAFNWVDYLAGQAQATLFHDPRWGGVMELSYGNRAFYLTAVRDKKIVGVLQLVEQRSYIFGSHLTSLPYFDAAGILADDEQARRSILASAGRIRKDRRVRWLELRQTEAISKSLPVRTDKVTMHLNLPDDAERLWNTLDAKVRNQIRKAKSSAFEVAVGGGELLDEFYAVYVRNMRDLGSPPHHRRFFKNILDAFASETKLFVIRSKSTPIAGSLVLIDCKTIRLPWAASDWRYRKECPNMLLYWSMLEYGCSHGMKVFDFGRSSRGSGTWKFKQQWGAYEVPLYWQYLLRPNEKIPDVRPDRGKFSGMIATWKRLPVCAARMIGPLIIRKLS